MQNLFPINGNLQLTLAFETVFVSELIAENRFGALLEISDKFNTKFNVLVIQASQAVQDICSSGLKQFGKWQNHTVSL